MFSPVIEASIIPACFWVVVHSIDISHDTLFEISQNRYQVLLWEYLKVKKNLDKTTIKGLAKGELVKYLYRRM